MPSSPNMPYVDRQTKAKYVAETFAPYLRGRVLDVGGFQGLLGREMPPGVQYTAIDLAGGEGVTRVDLEKEKIPFGDASFDCVLCLDVLEHVENVHGVFDEICRVAAGSVILSLPNPYGDLLGHLIRGRRSGLQHYGLPVKHPGDRHKWFFSVADSREFVRAKAGEHGMTVVQYSQDPAVVPESGARRLLQRAVVWKRSMLMKALFGMDFSYSEMMANTCWWILRKEKSAAKDG